ncbi:MAG: aminotransferase class III-fold pyridoxal phosphate-dependent enzyme [Flavobacteriaceae bacterium]|nr:aminotransferase class III-fold pyridoxal phosphate-dependent enzyme [Bacteroidia bacterium]NNL33906.1 aminotransferase class III-fold pyridoxal phosphate-dependent enzyme [Flavobacteriaceae bacterium]RZV70614.1 MAG: aminotransferase class III-fold pyridoxal phosphate-dependent enzyme [Flavobacteriaceae bacterium]RZW56110.1 MAG: aminotransferase class III-fold pyridoxal phosphate-dependent enzyme [Flavobacteriaceae bacterium]
MNNQQIIKNNLDYTLFSWSKQGGLNPINASHAKGSYIYDRDGKKYLDFSSQLMNVNIGHGNQRITDAVAKQMQEVSYVYPGMATDVRGKLGKKIAEITPGSLKKSFFTLGGAEAIENAIKLARMYTGRHKIITHYRAYHGATNGAISAGGDPRKFPVDRENMPGIVHVENPYAYRCPWNSSSIEECGEMAIAHLERVINFENSQSIAGILMEGESGSSGCIKYPPLYLKKVRALCDKYGIMLIDDEVMSGFGRTGKMFGIDNHEVTPDIMCLAKGLTSGYLPLGAVVVTEEIANHFNENPMVIGLTYSAHPTLCAAALENIKIIEEDNLVDRAAEMGKYIEAEVEKLKSKHPSIGDFRNTGLLGCIELVKNRTTKEPVTPWNAKPGDMEVTLKMASKIRELGMFTFVRWNWIFIAPPLNVSKEEVDEGLKIISEAISIADQYCN